MDWTVAGTSVQGRPLRVLRIGHGARRVLWIGGIHGDEPQGLIPTRNLPQAFFAAGLSTRVTLTILEDANPDGRATGQHDNANGVDLNRNFPARNFNSTVAEYGHTPLSQPESRAIDALLTSDRPQLVLVCHSFKKDQFVNFDGPGEALAQRFASLSPLPVKQSRDIGYRTPGSLGSYVGTDRGIPILTIEWQLGIDSTTAWHTTRLAILATIGT